MSHQLKKIEIKGYKSIKKQVIPLKELNVLIGQNGAGKSNFISLFRFLRNIIEQRLRNVTLKAGAESLLYYGSKETNKVCFELDFPHNFYSIKLEPANDNSMFIQQEQCGFIGGDNSSPLEKTIASSEVESKLQKESKTNEIAKWTYDVLKDWLVYHFHDTSESAGIKKYCSLADGRFLFEDASNLAAFLFVLKWKHESHYERIVKTVQLVIPFFKDFVLEADVHDEKRIRLEWCDKYSDKTFTAHELSDGSLRFICMATLLLQKDLPKMIILDEPELGLHPTAITVLSALLKKASKRSQVIISTQSVNLVNEFEPEEVIVVTHNEKESIFERLDPVQLEDWLEKYSLGELWDKNILGGRP